MLNNLWTGQEASRYIVAMHGGQVKAQTAATNAERGAELAAQYSARSWDVYFTPAGFSGTRAQANCVSVPGLWVDLDCGDGPRRYQDQDAALAALGAWCEKVSFPFPSYIVNSGHGIHAYWRLDAPCTHAEWLPVAQRFKRALAVTGLFADPARTADSASLMRAPGTTNYKDPDNPRPTSVLFDSGATYALGDLRGALPATGPVGIVPPGDRTAEWGTVPTFPEGDAEAIADQCQQMREVRDKRGAVPEPFWRAGLSVLQRCRDREVYIEAWSQGDARYDPQQATQKAAATLGPATCTHFDDVNPGGCLGCPFLGKITSPIVLSVAPAESAEQDPWKKSKVGRFTVTDQGIYYSPPAVEGAEAEAPTCVCLVPLWVQEHRERARDDDEQDRAHLVLQWRSLTGDYQRGVMPLASLTELREFRTWLGNHSLNVAVLDYKLMALYTAQYTAESMRGRRSRQYHTTLGWTGKGFVLGDRLITPTSVEGALVQSSNPISGLVSVGDVAKWSAGINVLGTNPDYRHHAFTMLAGFGSVLLGPVKKKSAIVSLVGPSGAGKTLAAEAALSIYGAPVLLGQGSASTDTAIELQLSANKDVPYLLDEVTQYHPKRLANLIYIAANGHGRASGTRTRDMRKAGSWQTSVFVTSNQPILEFAQDQIQEAQRRRLLELYFDNMIKKPDAKIVMDAVQNHYGSAAVLYLQEVSKLRADLPKLFDQAEAWLEKTTKLPDANRFTLWTMTAAWLGGTIAQSCGLLDGWDIKEIIKSAGTVAERIASLTVTEPQRASDTLREWLTENVARICYWTGTERDIGTSTNDPVARILGQNTIAVHARYVMDLMQEHRIPRAALDDALKPAILGRGTMRLAPGTPGIWTMTLDMREIGFGDDHGDN